MSPPRERYPLRPWVERAWRGEAGWGSALVLRPLELLYRAGAAVARFRAARGRRSLGGLEVIAIGGLTVGGAGKTTLARWAARAALEKGRRPAILLRGHGAESVSSEPRIVKREALADPASAGQFGDEAVAHRASLPAPVLVVSGTDRRRAASLARAEGADLVILDDGWEQGTLAWDHLWVVVDSVRPFANGRLLPAGPLRRSPDNLSQANVIVEIDETADEGSSPATAGLRRRGDHPPIVRFRRRVESWTRLGTESEPAAASPPRGRPVLLISSVGAPDRLERFLQGAGVPPDLHLAFPDHAAWDQALVGSAAAGLRDRSGAEPFVLVTDKDAARAALLPSLGGEVWVVRSAFEPAGDPGPLLAALEPIPGARGGAPRDGLG